MTAKQLLLGLSLALGLSACSVEPQSASQLASEDTFGSQCVDEVKEALRIVLRANNAEVYLEYYDLYDQNRSGKHHWFHAWAAHPDLDPDYYIHAVRSEFGVCQILGVTQDGWNANYGDLALVDDFKVPAEVVKPDQICMDTYTPMLRDLEKLNQFGTPTFRRHMLIDAHSDRAISRVYLQRGNGPWSGGYAMNDSYLLHTETLGGDPCIVRGFQMGSHQMDLSTGELPVAADLVAKKYTADFKANWRTYLKATEKIGEDRSYGKIKAVTFFENNSDQADQISIVRGVVNQIMEFWGLPTTFREGNPIIDRETDDDEIFPSNTVHKAELDLVEEYLTQYSPFTDKEKLATAEMFKQIRDYLGRYPSTWGNRIHDMSGAEGSVIFISNDQKRLVYINYGHYGDL